MLVKSLIDTSAIPGPACKLPESKSVSEQDLNDLFVTDSYAQYQNSFTFISVILP